MESVRMAFQKVKGDINSLNSEIESLRKELSETKEMMMEICEIIKNLNKKPSESFPTHLSENQTNETAFSTQNTGLEPLKPKNLRISTGNEGVPTDKQTNQQTNQQTEKKIERPLEEALEIINSLDDVKKDIRLKFKRLTKQELLVFSILYQLEEGLEHVNYKLISDKLGLTESSIRDYIGRLIKKGIPIEKTKVNNKNIHLSVSKNLRKITSLSTILKLVEL